MNHLYFGDNLGVLREHIKDETGDLIYLDPPFNSKRDYNLHFKTPMGHQSEAQIEALFNTMITAHRSLDSTQQSLYQKGFEEL